MSAKEEAMKKVADLKGISRAMDLLESVDKPMTKSKKFMGFMFIEITWKSLLAYSIYNGVDSATLMSMVAAAAATETAFMGAQAWHDKHVKGSKLTAMNGSASAAVHASLTQDAVQDVQ